MEKAVCYIRVSTEEQARGGVSLAAQEERLKAYCTLNGLEVVEVIREEGVSGAKPLASRPGGERLLKLLAEKRVKHVVALKLDRLFRDAEDALRQTKAWDKAGIALHLVDMGGQTLNTATAMGRFFLNMMAAFAELERNLMAERTAAALAHKKAHLEAYAPTPYGFKRVGDALQEDIQEQKTLAQIFAWRRAGWSLRKIAAELNRRGVPTKQGGQWHASTVRYLLQNSERWHKMERLLTPEEAAERLAVSPKSIRKWLREGKLKGVRAGRLWRIRERDLEAFLDPVLHVLETAPEDDEPLTEEDRKAIAEAERAIAQGKTKPWEQVKGEMEI